MRKPNTELSTHQQSAYDILKSADDMLKVAKAQNTAEQIIEAHKNGGFVDKLTSAESKLSR